ncbi:glutathione S-transferase [Achromobacter sp. UMC46]|uniref:glutathione S-transferase n=1 Tax=Achromobacter sp. UMC46 TaxID=1862319 RepID=UPI0016034E1E|nr:glutathione S-transferase [Achromobacter sp. UMC46]MBB1597781.1 glutathione S-transferase [Achromobacter sp. UMC46]
MKIYFSPVSPYVRKCLVVAHELDLSDRIALLPASVHPVERNQEVFAKNPLGKLPTLITDDGQVLYDSRVICEYLNHLAGGSLFPPPGPLRWTALALQSLGDGMLDAAVLARYEDAARPAPLRWDAWRAGQLDKVETSLKALDDLPERLAGVEIEIGKLAIACALWYLDLRFSDLGWRDRYPAVARWYADVSLRPSLQMKVPL